MKIKLHDDEVYPVWREDPDYPDKYLYEVDLHPTLVDDLRRITKEFDAVQLRVHKEIDNQTDRRR
jgi:hypothetical protein